ncbi:hypothetical protein [Kitasatospora sp. GP82]|uniref:hypothetical protein n=1 Tax=Kitasatospora sp. GP82 TaxID=3035089 RepID=UPI0024740361|nr:hypothetical protein [Kitasatospora sp. GP82]MDH6123499.1 hypothetical protein [Kitasatospora sp. GP82]
MRTSPGTTERALRTPRAAAVAGIVFSVLLGIVIVLVRNALPEHPGDAAEWFTNPSRRTTLQVALNLLPFSGISFLWFMAVVRSHIGAGEDKFFATVFLGSGLLFVATALGLAATAGGLLALADVPGTLAVGPPDQVWQFGRSTYVLLTTYAMRMAAVFTLSTSTIALRLGIVPRWLAVLGYLAAVVLLAVVGSVAWCELAFPVWTLVISSYILVATLRAEPARAGS